MCFTAMHIGAWWYLIYSTRPCSSKPTIIYNSMSNPCNRHLPRLPVHVSRQVFTPYRYLPIRMLYICDTIHSPLLFRIHSFQSHLHHCPKLLAVHDSDIVSTLCSTPPCISPCNFDSTSFLKRRARSLVWVRSVRSSVR